MNPTAVASIHARIAFLEANKHRLVIDADTHLTDLGGLNGPLRARYEAGPDYYHGRPISAEDLLAEMRLAGVDLALAWQNPAATGGTGDPTADFESLLTANRYVLDAAARFPEQILPGGWVDPKACGLEGALRMVDLLVLEFGMLIVKLNPAHGGFAIDSPDVIAVVERIQELGAIPAVHFGADTPFTPAQGLDRLATLNPYHPILALHMGGGGAGYVEGEALYHEARELGLRRPNLRFALSTRRDTHTESDLITYQLAGEPFSQNLFCASDAPYGRLAWNFGGFRALLQSLRDGARHPDPRLRAQPDLFSAAAVTNYLGRNFAQFAIDGYRFLLRVQSSGR